MHLKNSVNYIYQLYFNIYNSILLMKKECGDKKCMRMKLF